MATDVSEDNYKVVYLKELDKTTRVVYQKKLDNLHGSLPRETIQTQPYPRNVVTIKGGAW